MAVVALAAAFQVVVPYLSLPVGRGVSDVFVIVLIGFGAYTYLRRVPFERGRHRAAVLVGVGSCSLWTFANVIYLGNEFHAMPPAVTVAGAMSIGAALLLPLGMHLNAPPVPGAERYRGFLDVAAVSGAVFAITWVYILEPARHAVDAVMNAGFVTALTLPEVIAAAVALVTMSRHLPDQTGRAPRLLGAAAVVLACTALMAVRNGVEDLPWYTAGAGGGYTLAAGLVAVASRLEATRSTRAGTERHFSGVWALLPYVPIVLAVAATAAEQVHRRSLAPVLVWVLLGTFSLVLVRQFLTVSIVGRLAVTLQRQQSALAYQARHDALTGLPNRAAFHEVGNELVEQHGTVVVLLLDLDGFKPVNDRLGHAAGDEVLVEVARRLSAAVRPGDLVTRLGGDEFAMVLAEPATEEAGHDVAERVLRSLSEPMRALGEPVRVGGSIGLAIGGGELGELLRQADIAMYAAKADGKGRVSRAA
ncbi:hypothetical protein Ari01nite_23010 [Paractinoplanes rishiriensis]|uniref:GGDEF domain-containing protein n=1 Tax=Paractinoplanes rishiriensis TaxID=1050105 RepID=A0A919MP90_9ACTN|nr:hypothetical protein Ari01nite_23010 [Actinoplanes rishiriensis]